MKKILIIPVLILAMSLSCCAQQGTLTILADNFESDIGPVVANLFREQDDLPKKPFRTSSAMIKNGTATIVFDNLPHGNYALILFHDRNANNIIDHRFGLPYEQIGFSNSWRLSIFSGMPSFNKLKFNFPETVPYKIVMQ